MRCWQLLVAWEFGPDQISDFRTAEQLKSFSDALHLPEISGSQHNHRGGVQGKYLKVITDGQGDPWAMGRQFTCFCSLIGMGQLGYAKIRGVSGSEHLTTHLSPEKKITQVAPQNPPETGEISTK
jgi:hypothetical protein